MSFSLNVKKELEGNLPNARHCRIAELAALTAMAGKLENGCISISSENEYVAERFDTIYKKIFQTVPENGIISEKKGRKQVFCVALNQSETGELVQLLGLDAGMVTSESIYRQPCCKRAYLRGAFLACGSISDPEKDYHLEFVTDDDAHAEALISIIAAFDIDAKIVHRKKYSVVYLKDGECIVDILNIMEAHVCLMEFENIRILKEMRNSINRRVNCEAANIDKTIKAAGRQIDDINYLSNTIGLDSLSEELRATAILRLQYPDSSLAELGAMHDKPVGRSGVNHRLQKLSDMADRLRAGKPV